MIQVLKACFIFYLEDVHNHKGCDCHNHDTMRLTRCDSKLRPTRCDSKNPHMWCSFRAKRCKNIRLLTIK